jgi:uncharacterized protein YdhG (YjbR/CyaY superfamily)
MNTVEDYLQSFEEEVKHRLLIMREIIKTAAPEAEESFSYGIVGYKYKKKPLVYFGGFTHHIGFYATSGVHDAFKKEFAPFKQGKGSVQFPLDQPLPVELVKKVVAYRLSTIDKK